MGHERQNHRFCSRQHPEAPSQSGMKILFSRSPEWNSLISAITLMLTSRLMSSIYTDQTAKPLSLRRCPQCVMCIDVECFAALDYLVSRLLKLKRYITTV